MAKSTLNGKTALITGGGTGIGAAAARRFVEEGAMVCITGRRTKPLEETVAALPAGTVTLCAGDVSNPADVARMVATAVEFGGKLDVLVNNAALDQMPANIIDIDPDVWQQVMAVNLTGPFLLMKAALPHMIAAGGGSVINIASLAGIRSIPNMPAYAASKGGLIQLTCQAALDFGPHKIRCNVICPGAFRTAMNEEAMGFFADKLGIGLDTVYNRFSKDTPLKRVANVQEIGGLCSYLAGDDSAFLTGAVIPIDGGAAVVDVSGAAISAMVSEAG